MKKTVLKTVIGMVTMLALGFALTASAGKPGCPEDKQACLDQAAEYEKMAKEQKNLVSEHEKMRREFKKNAKGLPKGVREARVDEMNTHCGNIIANAKRLNEEYRSLSKMFTALAEEK